MRASNLATTLAFIWLNKVSFDLKEELVLPALLQEAGKFVLADIIDSSGKKEEFKKLISDGYTIADAEKKCVGITTSQVTAKIFRYWNLSENLIAVIEYVDDLDRCDLDCRYKSEILNVIKTICNVKDPMGIESIEEGIAKAKTFGLDVKSLKEAIEKLSDRLLDE